MKYIKLYENIDWVDEEKSNIPDDFKGNENFYNFLVDNNVLDKFIYNFNNYKLKKNINLKDFLNRYSFNFLNLAFKWSITPEGRNFWMNLHQKYNNLYLMDLYRKLK